MWKIITALVIVSLAGLYFWYVQGVDIWPLIEKARSIQIQIVLDKTADQLATPYYDPILGSWETLPDMPTARTEAAVAAVGKKIYVIGGLDGFGRTRGIIEVFDTETKTWGASAPLPAARHHASAVVLDGTLYVIGGYAGINFEPTKTVWAYRPALKRWEDRASLPHALGAAAAIAINTTDSKNPIEKLTSGKIYILGGNGTDGLSNHVFAYDPNNDQWEIKKDMPTAREHFGAALIKDKIYAAGGNEGTLTRNLDTLEVYWPKKNSWEKAPSMSIKHSGIAIAAADGILYVFGGENLTQTFNTVEAFDPSTEKWKNMNPMPDSRHGAGAVTVGGKIYVIGGGKRLLLSVSKINTVFTPSK